MSMGAPQGCMLCPLLLTLLTHDCAPTVPTKYSSNQIQSNLLMTQLWLFNRNQVNQLAMWCNDNNLSLIVWKAKEIVIGFCTAVEWVSSTTFLGVYRGPLLEKFWEFGSCTASNHKTLPCIVNAAGKIIGASLPSLLNIYNTHLACKATSIASDFTHPHTASSVSCHLILEPLSLLHQTV